MIATARAGAVPAVRLPAPARPSARGSLRLVPARAARARRGPFVAVALGLLGAGLLGLLTLNTVLAQDAFRLHALQVQGKVLADREQELQSAVEALQAPKAIDQRATALGMVPGGPPEFLQLPSGTLLGAGGAGATQPDLVGESALPPPTADAAADAAAAEQAQAEADARRGTTGTTGTAGSTGTTGTGGTAADETPDTAPDNAGNTDSTDGTTGSSR